MPASKPITERILKKDLVKLFTAVPHEFVDDFYDVLDGGGGGGGGDDVFPVDLDVVCKWLHVTKKVLASTLRDSYAQGTDYLVESAVRAPRADNRGGHNEKRWSLTVECFKRLCMRSRSKKAEEVRTYFIEMDDFVTRYTERIVRGLMLKLNKAEKRARDGNDDGPGWIYIFRVDKKIQNIVKVGYTNDLVKRISSYNTGRADDIQMLATYETQHRMKAEDCVKTFSMGKRYKARRELYVVEPDVVRRVMQMCAALGDRRLHHDERWNMKAKGNYYILFSEDNLLDRSGRQ